MNRIICFSTLLIAVLSYHLSYGQERQEVLVYKNGTEQSVTIVQEKNHTIECLYEGKLKKIPKSDLLKIIYLDGSEEMVEEVWTENTYLDFGAGLSFSFIGSYRIVPLFLNLEFVAKDFGKAGKIGAGLALNYSQYCLGDKDLLTAVIHKPDAEVFVGYHFFFAPRASVYLRAGAGYAHRFVIKNFSSGTQMEQVSGLSVLGVLGFSYKFTHSFGLMAELGYLNGGMARLGLVFTM